VRLALCRSLVLLAALVAAGAGVASDAAAAANDKGVLSMQPARRTLTARPPLQLSPTRVSNSTPLAMQVTVFPALLVQDLDGSFSFNEDPRELNAARLMFPVGPSKFRLEPNQSRNLDLRWQLLPRSAKAAYLGLVVQGVPITKGKGVGSILRLLGINFFKLPGKFTVDGRLSALRGEQAGPRVLRFFPRVRNTGQMHSQPRNGHCKVVDTAGTVRVRDLKFGQGVVLPGYQREYPVLVQKPNILPKGSYQLKCAMRFGKRLSTKALPFTLSAPNTLPTASLKLRSVTANGEIGGSAKVKAVVRNAGSKAASALLKVRVDRVPVGRAPVLLARGRFPQGSVGAGGTRGASMSLAKLVAGSYRVTVVLSDGKTDLDERTTDFTASLHRGLFKRITDWLSDHLPWLILVVALLLILFLVWRQRRKQRELEEERARSGSVPPVAPVPTTVPAPTAAPDPEPVPLPAPAARAPAHVPVPVAVPALAADGAININTASTDELTQLPGVGRRAAERIVAHREANGPFASLDELSAIEGFHGERIRRLGEAATV
jgi:competence ComEA-like helix-hairpin-helix protein